MFFDASGGIHLGSIPSHNCPRLFLEYLFFSHRMSIFVLWGIDSLVLLLFVRPSHLVDCRKVNVDTSNIFNMRLGIG